MRKDHRYKIQLVLLPKQERQLGDYTAKNWKEKDGELGDYTSMIWKEKERKQRTTFLGLKIEIPGIKVLLLTILTKAKKYIVTLEKEEKIYYLEKSQKNWK